MRIILYSSLLLLRIITGPRNLMTVGYKRIPGSQLLRLLTESEDLSTLQNPEKPGPPPLERAILKWGVSEPTAKITTLGSPQRKHFRSEHPGLLLDGHSETTTPLLSCPRNCGSFFYPLGLVSGLSPLNRLWTSPQTLSRGLKKDGKRRP